MAAQDDINAADTLLDEFIAAAPEIISALEQAGSPVTTAQLAADTATAQPLLTQIQGLLPGAPAPAPPAG